MKINLTSRPFGPSLQKKIDALWNRRSEKKLAHLVLPSPLILAPMASICNAPYRLLMQDLGAAATVSELISAHGINYENQHTLNMLRIDEKERFVGIQLFGEDGPSLAKAAQKAEEFGPHWIDINLGCPVKKVVTKGAGSALLKDPKGLASILKEVKASIKIPLTIKIRTGWDADQINADEIMHVAKEEGVSFVAIHGRTRAQQYTGLANWDYIEELAQKNILPLIGNGDLHSPSKIRKRMEITQCQGLMIARGALRNPFIFLESLASGSTTDANEKSFALFSGPDYFEVIERLANYHEQYYENERTALVQLKKYITWYASGFPHAVSLRQKIFTDCGLKDSLDMAQEFFCVDPKMRRAITIDEAWMSSGHG
jgi:tRNA-dihydrouridine synthase B